MKTKFQRLIFLAAAFIIALFNFSEVALAEDVSSDPPPTIYWLDVPCNGATYMGNGVVGISNTYSVPGLKAVYATEVGMCNLNSEIIFPIGEKPWTEENFFGDYLLIRQNSKCGLLDRFGNIAVPVVYDTEKEAWAQVGIDSAAVTSPPNFPIPLVYYDVIKGFYEVSGYYACPDYYYDENRTERREEWLVLACEFDEAFDFICRDYARVTKDGRNGLLKNPLKKDVISDWFTDEIADADACGLIPSRCAGYYTFEITRSQAAALLVRYLELVTGSDLSLPAEHPFTDTSDAYIEKAYAAGIVQGMAEGIFAPDKVVTREQFATMLYRTLVKQNPDWEETVPEPTKFEDFDTASDWAKQALAVLADRKVMNGISDTKLAPKYYCSTEEAIALVYRLFKAEDKASV